MFISFLSLAPMFVAVFLFSLWRPKIAIFLPVIFHVSFLVKTKIFFVPSTGLEMLIIGVLAGVWIGMYLQNSQNNNKHHHPREGGDLSVSCHSCESRNPSNSHALIPASTGMTWMLIVLFVLSATVSAIIAPHPATAWGAWKALIIEPILYAVTLICFVKRYNLWSRFISALLGGGVVSCLLSLVFWRFGTDFWRFRGIYDVPNSLALILAPLLVVAVLALLVNFSFSDGVFSKDQTVRKLPFPRRRESWLKNNWPIKAINKTSAFAEVGRFCVVGQSDDTMLHGLRGRRWFLMVTICVFSILLIATQSIAGIVSVGVALMFIFFINKRLSRRVMIGLFLIALLATSAQIFSGKIPHLLNRTSSSLIAREQIWTVAVSLVKDHLLLGTGLGTFEPTYQEKLKTLNKDFGSSGVLEWVVRDPHNIFLSFWLNTGLLGLLSMAGLVFLAIKKSILITRSFADTDSEGSSYFPLIRGIKGVWSHIIVRTPLLLPLSGERHDASSLRSGRHQAPQARGRGHALVRGEQQTQYRMLAGVAMLTLIIFGLFDVPYWKNDLALLWWVYLVSAIL